MSKLVNTKTCQKEHAESGAQKNPRREFILTGIYALNLKLKYGGCSFPSTMLNIFYQIHINGKDFCETTIPVLLSRVPYK